jgi:hypothetical protein
MEETITRSQLLNFYNGPEIRKIKIYYMPHIRVDGCNMNRQIKQINIHAEMVFAKETWQTPRAELKMEELKQKLEDLICEYFDLADIRNP